eukprot:TRINITY_DN41008_c0_g1_i1.p1 TRINITY_DN41008_c0_g1~~TRINITY_DN41008_c0_g1_i1.p1  ORF type:complete len:349 (+),score=76.16 TRINITY_DN41008_c0_g1_i1:146-1192(+)
MSSVRRSSSTAGIKAQLLNRRVTVGAGTLDSNVIMRMANSGSETSLVRRGTINPAASSPLQKGGASVLLPKEAPARLGSKADPEFRAGSKAEPVRLGSKAEAPSVPAVKKGSKEQADSLGSRSMRLAKAYRLDFFDVKYILEELEKTDKTSSGSLTQANMKDYLMRVFGSSHIPEDLLKHLHNHTCVDLKGNAKAFDVEAFLDWYMMNIFTVVSSLKGDPKAVASRELLTKLCKNYGLQSGDLDKIKKRFDQYDLDGSGLIDQDEFVSMLANMLKAKKDDLSKDRLKNWWKEIDSDGSGEVDFEEFLEWYLKYFGTADNVNPTEAFYASFNPSMQRQTALAAQALEDC